MDSKITDRPNIIMLILDGARQDMFGCYGNTEGLTPNIDAIAKEGVVLKNHYAAGCGSAQAHVSIFTGQHSERHRMVHNFCDVDDNIKAIPLLLKQIGYKTFGHMKAAICPPAGYGNLFGFDEMICPGAEQDNADMSTGGGSKTHIKSKSMRQLFKKMAKKIIGEERLLRRDAKMYDGKESLQYLLQKTRQNKGNAPVLACSTLLHPHLPYFPPRDFVEKIAGGRRIDKLAYKIQKNPHAYTNGDFGEAKEAMDSIRILYKAELLYVDHLVGEFVGELKSGGVLDNSILIIMSDHGEYLGEHQLVTHGAMVWEELFNIPCIMRYPEKIQAGSTVEFMTSALDIMPTLFGLICGKDYLTGKAVTDGRDVFEKRGDWDERYLVVDSPPAVLPERLKTYPKVLIESTIIYRAIRTKKHKYIWQSNGQEYLFTARSRESTETNILEDNRNLAHRFKEKMVDFYRRINPEFKIDEYPVKIGKKAVKKIGNPVIRKELERLGYLK